MKTSPPCQTSQSPGGPTTRSQTRKAAEQETKQETKTSPLDQNTRSHGDPKTTSQKKQGAKQKAKQGGDETRTSFTSSTYRWPSDM